MIIYGLVDLSSINVKPDGGRWMRPVCKWAEVGIRPPEPPLIQLGEWSVALHGVPKRQVDIFRKHGGKRLAVAFLVLGDSGTGRVTGTMLYRGDLKGVVELEGTSQPMLDGKPWIVKETAADGDEEAETE